MLHTDSASLFFHWVFWISSFLVVYPYVIYPLVLFLCNRLLPAKRETAPARDTRYRLSFIISAYNEEKVIAKKLQNTLDLQLDEHAITIYVVSDASDDNTDQIVTEWSKKDPRIKLVRQRERKGKTAGLNSVMSMVEGDLVVFSDANAMYEPDAVKKLIQPFANTEVGYVVGTARYTEGAQDASQISEGLYWKYELWIKKQESDFHSVVGGDGAIYAIRRKLFWPLKETDINDFVNPLQIIAKGYKGVFSESAKCSEEASDEFKKEFNRKRRIVNRSWRAVLTYAGELSLFRHALFLFMLISHKVIRWFSVLFILIALLSLTFLIAEGSPGLYLVFFCTIAASITTALLGWYIDSRGHEMPKLVYISYYFYLVGIASLLGIWDNARGLRFSTWGHIRN